MSIIICPNCKSILSPIDKIYRCDKGHSFDLSKEGYINLLLPNQKKKLKPGDNKVMLNARDAFLSNGHYDFLIEAIDSAFSHLDLPNSPQQGASYLLDIGCGTGYYTRTIRKSQTLKKIGLDISKEGISKAAKKDKSNTYLVASSFALPIANDSIDIALSIFSPFNLEEVNRVLKPGGCLIKVIPDPQHMQEVAALVYDTIIPHRSSIETDLESNGNFKIIDKLHKSKEISLSNKELHDFITMTPYLYKFKPGQIEQLKELSITISFKIIIGQNQSNNTL